MANQLYTKWGKQLDEAHILQEYPRPQLQRESYLNLNGRWDYAITPTEDIPERYDGSILVPFSPETVLSGVQRQLQPDEYLHYRRYICLSREFLQGRCLLHFGAADQSCTVYVNGEKAGGHVGGYLPFTLDVTEFVHTGENELYVCVQDLSDTSYHARGKQKLERGGMWYMAQSGIWQTVWMECVPQCFIRELKMDADYDHAALRLKVLLDPGDTQEDVCVKATVSFAGEYVTEKVFHAGKTASVPIPEMKS